MVRWGFILACFANAASALPAASIRRQVSQLRSNYDFIIAGGGTSGLTVADRLTEAFPNRTVLVIEYGEIEYAPGVFDPPSTSLSGFGNSAGYFLFQSPPVPDVKNRTALVLAGKAVGGSSTVNGMFFDRGSQTDHDAWSALGSPQVDAAKDKWNWASIYPYFKKSVTFTAPSSAVVEEHGYTWDDVAYGGSTPIYSSFPPFLWGDHRALREIWSDLDIPAVQECADGDKNGMCWIPYSAHPVTFRRSHAGLGHYAAVNTTRSNYDLLVKHQVTRVIYSDGNTESGPPIVEVRSLDDDRLFNVTATAEVILSAGAIHTPTILQRSGIGPASFLNSADIPVVLDLPGVGSNFQDHSGAGISWNWTTPGNFSPQPSDMEDPAFAAAALAEFNETPARGPYTIAGSSTAIFLPLANITDDYQSIADSIRAMVADGSAASYLPADYRAEPAMIQGYEKQLSVLADLSEKSDAPSMETPFATGTSIHAISLHPLSRGTVRLNTGRPLSQPIIDYRTGSNPVDFDIYLAHIKFLRRLFNTTTMQRFGAVEVTPGARAQSDAALVDYIKDDLTFSFMHPCCTTAMMPEDDGGVVGTDLKVHGAAGLRIVDMGVLPILPSAHLSATAYAVGEKAADIIIGEWSMSTASA
ncbi:Oxygen-dependent choline dehydrogenase [Madurella mycetomatis]|uniref:Oxygen-dependent choline dehydrogenase n=1 Tax=Madurella mycetomatis TaxID=100816 RepID=A0A175W230_9PEZI|nr:Oxygen-dependent choline dehydrogenase [Madurella mycetomatis]